MKIARGFCIWIPLALCGVMVLGAMTWLTRGVLASERERVLAESRADLEERTRLALWRMDADGAAIVAGENRHPVTDYQPGSGAFPTVPDSLTKLHFELRESGRLSSPYGADATGKLSTLRTILGKNPVPGAEWTMLKCAAEASEEAWSQVPKEAPVQSKANLDLRKFNNNADNRNSWSYQQNFNGVEKAQRAKTVENTVANSADPFATDSKNAVMIPPVSMAGLGPMRAIWVGQELFLLRQFSSQEPGGGETGVQGVWLDHIMLKQRLLESVSDLLADADLVRTTDSAQDPLALVSFPFHLVRNESVPADGPLITAPLLVGWIAVLLALATASWLVHGVMRLSERRASFVSAVTHELRTPLTTFRLYSDMLQSDAVKPEKRGDYLRVLSREADRLAHLVENVLSFSKIERGSARSAVREVEVDEFLESMRDRFEARLATAEMRLEMDSSCKLRLRLDAAAVEHVLFNLIDNAAKYAAGGDPPVVKIHTVTSFRHLEIIVSDSGPGIPVSERRRIFQAFHKSAREAAESRPGVGLGLALSRRLAKSLGGGLECVDAEKGARFVLRLPLVK